MESSSECGIELPDSISHVVSYTFRKETLGSPRRRWENNIRMDLIGFWVDSAQLKIPCECSIEPPGSISHVVRLIAWMLCADMLISVIDNLVSGNFNS